ncbi:MAG: glycosyltransferase, partial [Patescibacteria group bacterium]|nr:glycosyltransferase [Patescibacteria group bacterium]
MYRIIFSNYDDVRNPHYGGGGALAVHEIAKRLAGDFNVTVLTGKYRNCRNETIDGVNYERIGANIFGPKIGQLIFQIALSFYARRKKYDLWVESFTPPFSTSFLPLFTKKPVIGLAHTLAGKDAARKYKLPFHFIEKQGLKVYQNFIAVSKFVKTEILAANPKAQVHVIPNGVDWPETKRQPLGEYILFLGRMEVDQKGLDLLLKAYCQILDKVNFPLYIAGAGTAKEESKLKKLINSLGL